MDFAGMNCLVTGGSAGIGRACVEMFASKGAKVFTFARKEEDPAEVVNALAEKGYDVQGSVCDVTDTDALKELLEKMSQAFEGKLHILVNNIGTALARTFVEGTKDDLDLLINVNVKSLIDVSQLTYPMLKASGGASVINIGSTAGARCNAYAGFYSMTKSAIESLTRTLACEWAVDNIRVNCIAPGLIRTNLTAAVLDDPDFIKMWCGESLMGRFGQPHEISSVAAFFASSASSYITGQTLYVDGGCVARGLGYGSSAQ